MFKTFYFSATIGNFVMTTHDDDYSKLIESTEFKFYSLNKL